MKSVGGPDLLIFLVLAVGGAMFVGNLLALVRPPSKPLGGKHEPHAKRVPTPDLVAAPKRRTLIMMAVGGVVSLWAIATLLSR